MQPNIFAGPPCAGTLRSGATSAWGEGAQRDRCERVGGPVLIRARAPRVRFVADWPALSRRYGLVTELPLLSDENPVASWQLLATFL
ncbi:MAG: hypothetical protein QOI89_1149 [Solirubrobacteraceae bacterium]|jgi:hypothetical protein|nr:hypothetical protein [Solirubrobacteraceae bacterium]